MLTWQTEIPTKNGDYWIVQNSKVQLGYFLSYDKTFRYCGDPHPYGLRWLNGLTHWAKVEYPNPPSMEIPR